jgi:hypothetical protein
LPCGVATAGVSRDLSAAWASTRRLRRSGRHPSSSGRLFVGGRSEFALLLRCLRTPGAIRPRRLRLDPSGAARRPVVRRPSSAARTPRACRLREQPGCFGASRVLCHAEGAERRGFRRRRLREGARDLRSRFCRFPPDFRQALETLAARALPAFAGLERRLDSGPGHVRSTRSRPLARAGFDPRPTTRPIGSTRSLVGRTRFLRTRSPGGSLPRRRPFGVGPNHRAAPRRLRKPCGCPPRSRERCVSSTSANQPAPRAPVDFARFPLAREE